jgi:hypothetical protein
MKTARQRAEECLDPEWYSPGVIKALEEAFNEHRAGYISLEAALVQLDATIGLSLLTAQGGHADRISNY